MPEVLPKTLEEIANAIDGELLYPPSQKQSKLVVDSLASSPESSTDLDLVFVFKEKHLKDLTKIKSKALILPTSLKEILPSITVPVIFVQRPRLVLKKLLDLYVKERHFPDLGVHPTAIIDKSSEVPKSCKVGANVFVGPNSQIGENTVISSNVFVGQDVVIGKNCFIYPNCSILDGSKIGNNVIIHSGVVIGSDGYSYVTEEESNLEKAKKGNFNFNYGRQIQHKILSIGNVVLEDDVEIGANTCIDRGTIGSTVIGQGTKIDNLVQIAHNAKIGKDCLIVGQVGIAGSVNIGDRVIVGGQCGFADNINIGSDVIFLGRSGVHGNIASNSVYFGMPAVSYSEYLKNERTMKRLPRKQEKLEEQVRELQEKVKTLEEKLKISV